MTTLGTKEARQIWEKIFNQHYIQPVLTNLDKNLATAMDLVANDKEPGLLFYLSHIHTGEIIVIDQFPGLYTAYKARDWLMPMF